MANSTSNNPLILDTAVANWAALSLPNKLPLLVVKIEWKSPVNVNDTFSIVDASGAVIHSGTCEVAGQTQVWNFDGMIKLTQPRGWYLSQISSGQLYIWFK